MKNIITAFAMAAMALLLPATAAAQATDSTVVAPDSTVMAPDFTLNDLNGQPLTLSSLRGKYVMLDFWGSWCIWCVRGIPQMKATYEKYKDRMEILSIDCGDTEKQWKDAVKEYALPWLHVQQPKNGAVQTLKLYKVQGFPTKVVIDPEGRIVHVCIGEDPAFYTYLDGLFSTKQ